jgi:hypothetical protein
LPRHHEAASKFVSQKFFRLNNQQANRASPLTAMDFLGRSGSIESGGAFFEKKPMKKLAIAILLFSSPAWAQTKLPPKSVTKSMTTRADPCAPIGRMADGKAVYSLKCDNLPEPPPPPPPVAQTAPPPAPEAQSTGLMGLFFDRKRSDQ